MAGKVTWTVRLEAIDAVGTRLEMSELVTIVRDLVKWTRAAGPGEPVS
jgi:hypothetical protein